VAKILMVTGFEGFRATFLSFGPPFGAVLPPFRGGTPGKTPKSPKQMHYHSEQFGQSQPTAGSDEGSPPSHDTGLHTYRAGRHAAPTRLHANSVNQRSHLDARAPE
jgi:hypothetical protein